MSASSDLEAAHTLLRCVQEIVTNAARHSGAANLWIVIEQEDGNVRKVSFNWFSARLPAG